LISSQVKDMNKTHVPMMVAHPLIVIHMCIC